MLSPSPVPDLSTGEALLRLLLAAGLGGAIGLERELRDHEAGFRTHLLVSLGSCAFTLVSSYGWSDWTFSNTGGVVFDPTRIAAQIVTGIGFLGAGAIIVRGINVRGLTTAATLWVVAAIGMASGTGYYEVAVGAAVLVLVSLGPLKLVSARFISRVRPEEAELAIALKPEGNGAQVLARIEELGGQVNTVEFGDDRTMDIVLRASRRSESARIAELLARLEGVERVQWRP
jgi:putative Mg2+ transporter-C (MgtC) family protein